LQVSLALATLPTLPGWNNPSTSTHHEPPTARSRRSGDVRREPGLGMNGIGRASHSAVVLRRSRVKMIRYSDSERMVAALRHGDIVIGIKPEMIAAYQRADAAVWPLVWRRSHAAISATKPLSARAGGTKPAVQPFRIYHGHDFAPKMAAYGSRSGTKRWLGRLHACQAPSCPPPRAGEHWAVDGRGVHCDSEQRPHEYQSFDTPGRPADPRVGSAVNSICKTLAQLRQRAPFAEALAPAKTRRCE